MKLRPKHDLATLLPRPDIHAEVHGLLATGGEIETELWGKVKVGNPIQYKVTAKRNNFAFGEVVALGGGTPVGSGMDKPECQPGDIVGFDLGQAGHWLPDGTISCLWKNLLCRFAPGADTPEPLSSWVMSRRDEIAMQRLMLSAPGTIHLPGHVKGSVSTTSGKPKSSVRLTAEPIMKVGRGSFAKKVFVEPDCVVGETAVFAPTSAVNLAWTDSRVLSFVKWSDVEFTFGGE